MTVFRSLVIRMWLFSLTFSRLMTVPTFSAVSCSRPDSAEDTTDAVEVMDCSLSAYTTFRMAMMG